MCTGWDQATLLNYSLIIYMIYDYDIQSSVILWNEMLPTNITESCHMLKDDLRPYTKDWQNVS